MVLDACLALKHMCYMSADNVMPVLLERCACLELELRIWAEENSSGAEIMYDDCQKDMLLCPDCYYFYMYHREAPQISISIRPYHVLYLFLVPPLLFTSTTRPSLHTALCSLPMLTDPSDEVDPLLDDAVSGQPPPAAAAASLCNTLRKLGALHGEGGQKAKK